MIKRTKGFIGWLLILTGLALAATPATANGVPVKIFLSYLPQVSNYGPLDANGVALVSIGEAWLELDANGLPQLTDEMYEAWLASADIEQMVSLGTFNAGADKKVTYTAEFESIPVLDYRFFIISVEPVPDPNPGEADSRRVLAGVFPDPQLQIVSNTPAPISTPEAGSESGPAAGTGEGTGSNPAGEPGPAPTPPPPTTLPVSGGGAGADLSLFILGLGISLVGLIALSLPFGQNASNKKRKVHK